MRPNGMVGGGAPCAAATVGSVHSRVADVLVDILASAGIDVVFGLPGGTISPLHDALLDREDVRVVTSRHESGAMFAAAAYAAQTGKPGVVLVTSGPGILNTITGLASAHCDSLPLVVLAGEVPRSLFGRNTLQDGSAHHLNIVATTQHISKLSMQATSPSAAPAMLRRAMATATSGRRGPVVLSLPIDVSSARIEPFEIAGGARLAFMDESGEYDTAIAGAATLLHTAQRPLILAGNGCRFGGAPRALRQLAERLQIPVATTPKGKGVFPEGHPLSVGVFGHGGHLSASTYASGGLDVLLAVGTSLSDPATDGWSDQLEASRAFIHVDLDLARVARAYTPTLAIVGDADRVLTRLRRAMPKVPRPPRQFGVVHFSDPEREPRGPSGMLTPQHALWELQRALGDDALFTSDIGEHLLFATHYLRIDRPDAWLTMTGLASMGSGIAGALGAKLGAPRRPVAAIIGDGCFMMSIGDLATAAHENLPLVVAVLNDFRYGMVEAGHEQVYGRRPHYPLGPVDVAAVARGVGARAVTVRRPGELSALDLGALLEGGPLVLDIHVDPAVRLPKNKRNRALSQFAGTPVLN